MLTRLLQTAKAFFFALPALAIGLVLWQGTSAGDISSSLHRVLPLILACLGSGLCVLYGRIRPLFLLMTLYAVILVLQGPLAYFHAERMLSPYTKVIFHGVSLWVPLIFVLMVFWNERGRPGQDIALRLTVLLILLGPFALLAFQDAEGMQRLISDTYWPWAVTGFSTLAQVPAWIFLFALVGLGWHAHRQQRPFTVAAALALLFLYWMLPRIFHWPQLSVIVPVMGMVLIISAVVQEAFELAFNDELTGLPGRRALNEALRRLGSHYTIAMVDVDHFKKFNDTHGHDAGDDVLKLVASRLGKVGGGGRAFRYGGEEFALVFDGIEARHAREAIEAVRESIEQSQMQLRNRSNRDRDDTQGSQRRGQGGSGKVVQVTASIGVADHRAGDTPQAVIKAADKALYAAKDAGRNCVRVHGLRSVAEIVGVS